MDEERFRTHLKRKGKKDHVVDGLVGSVRAFESYLDGRHLGPLDAADEQALRAYAETLAPREIKERMRGLALYYGFAGNGALAHCASSVRERLVATTRQPFKLRGFRGVSPDQVARLEEVGIATVDDMLAAGASAEARQQLAERTGVPSEAILELVKLSDISRVGAIKGVRARLYYDAGLDTPDRFAEWEPDALRQYLVEWVARTGFDGIAPLPKELRNAVSMARKLPAVVQY